MASTSNNNNVISEEVLRAQESIYNQDVEVQEDENNVRSLLVEFIKKLKPGTDMYRITVPALVLEPVSFLEKITNFSPPHNNLINAVDLPSAEARFLAVTNWVISFFRKAPKKGFTATKPYNPILGETFYCHWEHGSESTTHFIAEQVSHHPPVSAFYMTNPIKGITYEGHLAPKSKYNGNSVASIMEGRFVLHFSKLDERYTITLPHIVARGIIMGNQFIEINKTIEIVCEKTGYKTVITCKSKSNHEVAGEVIFAGKKKTHSFKGTMNKAIIIVDEATKKEAPFIEFASIQDPFKRVTPVAEQGPFESRRIWHQTTVELKNKKFEAASVYKTAVEEDQRKIQKARKAGQIPEHVPKYFKKQGDAYLYARNYPSMPNEQIL